MYIWSKQICTQTYYIWLSILLQIWEQCWRWWQSPERAGMTWKRWCWKRWLSSGWVLTTIYEADIISELFWIKLRSTVQKHTYVCICAVKLPPFFCTGAHSYYCDGAVNQAGKNLFSHIITYPKVADKVTSPRKAKSENVWAFKQTLISKNRDI